MTTLEKGNKRHPPRNTAMQKTGAPQNRREVEGPFRWKQRTGRESEICSARGWAVLNG